jgi:catechol 2,3-dioxygenase-like lactoylglutathione lyase family enzyme
METATGVVRGIDASYYMTKDLDVSTKFYNDLLGMEPTVHVPGMFAEYTFPGGESFGIYKSDNFYESGTVMFRVDDVASFVKAAVAKGVHFHGDGFVDETPVCHMAFGRDPDGNHFMVHKVK